MPILTRRRLLFAAMGVASAPARAVRGHTGVCTAMDARPSTKNGVVLLVNTGGVGSHVGRIAEQLLLQKV